MKSIVLYIALLLLVYSNCLYAQSCLQNDRFQNACSAQVYGGSCPTWTDECGGGWIRSHGTPQMVFYTDNIGPKPISGFYVQMWSTGSSGEGMFTTYPFQANRAYDVRLYIATSNPNGSVDVYAANGLMQSGLSYCGGSIPNIPSKQFIGRYTGFTNGWLEVNFTFIANANYSQIWIYPVGSGVQYDLTVRTVQVCPSCEGTIIYNNGIVPTGESRAGTIVAGSSAGIGGSGTVTVNPTATTTFTAVDKIVLLPQFSATVTSGSFYAKAYYCGTLPQTRMAGIDTMHIQITPSTDNATITTKPVTDNKNYSTTSRLNESNGQIEVYPSVGNGIITIAGGVKQLENVEISVYDQLGRHLFRTPKSSYSNTTTLNLSHLKKGIYVLQIRQREKIFTKKIIIQP